jgi:hypothetical protein
MSFAEVSALALRLGNVEPGTRYDGSPVLRAAGCFMAGPATHPSASPHSIVVPFDIDDRAALIEDAPATYYVTAHYEKYPVVLVRLAHIDETSLLDLLGAARRLALAKSRPRAPGRTSRRSQTKGG